MRFCSDDQYKNRKEVAAEYPAAAKIIKAQGGWTVFDTITDYETWRKQK